MALLIVQSQAAANTIAFNATSQFHWEFPVFHLSLGSMPCGVVFVFLCSLGPSIFGGKYLLIGHVAFCFPSWRLDFDVRVLLDFGSSICIVGYTLAAACD